MSFSKKNLQQSSHAATPTNTGLRRFSFAVGRKKFELFSFYLFQNLEY